MKVNNAKMMLTERIWTDDNDTAHNYEGWYELQGLNVGGREVMRVNIVADRRPLVSTARAYVWSPIERRWNVIAVIPVPLMHSTSPPDPANFLDDILELLEITEAVIGV